MKRFFITVILITVLFSSCGEEPEKILEYQKYPISLTGILTIDDLSFTSDILLEKEGSLTLKITSPESLSGYSFLLEGERLRVLYDGVEAELCSLPSAIPLSWVRDMLCLMPEDYKYSREEGKILKAFFADGISETVIFSENKKGFPCRIEHTKNNKTLILEII